MLLQSDINDWRLSQSAKLDKLYINSELTRLLQRSKIKFIEYKNQKIPDNPHLHLIFWDAASSYHCTSPIIVSKIPKWGCICADRPRMNSPYL